MNLIFLLESNFEMESLRPNFFLARHNKKAAINKFDDFW